MPGWYRYEYRYLSISAWKLYDVYILRYKNTYYRYEQVRVTTYEIRRTYFICRDKKKNKLSIRTNLRLYTYEKYGAHNDYYFLAGLVPLAGLTVGTETVARLPPVPTDTTTSSVPSSGSSSRRRRRCCRQWQHHGADSRPWAQLEPAGIARLGRGQRHWTHVYFYHF